MGWLTDFKNLFPFTYTNERKTIVQLNKVNVFDLEVCKPKGILREQSFGRSEKLDFYHLKENGTVEHTLG